MAEARVQLPDGLAEAVTAFLDVVNAPLGGVLFSWETLPEANQRGWIAAVRAAQSAVELCWAPYREFGIPDPAKETHEPPACAITVRATGYRGGVIIVYWEAAQ